MDLQLFDPPIYHVQIFVENCDQIMENNGNQQRKFRLEIHNALKDNSQSAVQAQDIMVGAGKNLFVTSESQWLCLSDTSSTATISMSDMFQKTPTTIRREILLLDEKGGPTFRIHVLLAVSEIGRCVKRLMNDRAVQTQVDTKSTLNASVQTHNNNEITLPRQMINASVQSDNYDVEKATAENVSQRQNHYYMTSREFMITEKDFRHIIYELIVFLVRRLSEKINERTKTKKMVSKSVATEFSLPAECSNFSQSTLSVVQAKTNINHARRRLQQFISTNSMAQSSMLKKDLPPILPKNTHKKMREPERDYSIKHFEKPTDNRVSRKLFRNGVRYCQEKKENIPDDPKSVVSASDSTIGKKLKHESNLDSLASLSQRQDSMASNEVRTDSSTERTTKRVVRTDSRTESESESSLQSLSASSRSSESEMNRNQELLSISEEVKTRSDSGASFSSIRTEIAVNSDYSSLNR